MRTLFSKLLLAFLILFGLAGKGLCTELPKPVVEFIRSKFPQANIRFDGYVELPDKTAYLPVLPLIYENSDKPLEVTQTIPAGQDFSARPDMVLFSNNLALLKIIRKGKEPPTVITSTQMPLKVKLGILPQDLVVPTDLVLPVELKVILGDLKIPLKEKTDTADDIAFYNRKNTNKPEKQVNFIVKTSKNAYSPPELKFLNKKKLYTINSRDNKLYVLNPATGRVNKTIQLPSVPLNMAVTPDKRYILAAGSTVDKVFVVDTVNNEFIKSIEVGKFPSSIICIPEINKAYVANKFSSTVSEIDLTNMQVTREIPVIGSPDNLIMSDNNIFIYYNDYATGNIYRYNPATGEAINLFHDKNIAKIEKFGDYIFSLSRTENTLSVFDNKTGETISRIEVKEKPVDFQILDKKNEILVLCAGSDELKVIDMTKFEVINTVPLKTSGFPGKIILGENRVIITDYDSYEMVIYDTDTKAVSTSIPVEHIIGSIVIID